MFILYYAILFLQRLRLPVMPEIFVIVAAIVFQPSHANAQEIIKKRFPIKNLGYESGLLDNSVNAVATDAQGFTWLSTITGLQRFNGYRLQTINPVAGKDTFQINYPVYLFPLHDGSILLSIKSGLLKYDPYNDKFILLVALSTANSFHFGIVPLKEDGKNIWCLQQNKGVVLYNNDGKLLKQFSFLNTGITNNIFQSEMILREKIFVTDEHFIYINITHKSVLRVNTDKNSGSIINPPKEFSSIECLDDKLYLADLNNVQIINASDVCMNKKLVFDSAENITGTTLQKKDHAHLFLSRNGHLYVTDTGVNIQYELTDRDKKSFVSNGNIQYVYADKLNRIWILSNNDVKRVENTELLFQNFVYEGNQSNFIRALYYDKERNILLAGGYNGLIQAYDTLANPLWKQAVITKKSEYLLSIEKLTANEYLVVPFVKEPFIFNINTKKVFPVVSAGKEDYIKKIQTNYPCNLQRINDSTLLIATNSTVYKCIFKGNKIVSAVAMTSFTTDKKLNCFLYTSNKKLWTGTSGGLLYLTDEKGTHNIKIPGDYTVRSMAENNRHQVYIGTEKGLLIYDDAGVLLKKYNVASGLRNDCIYAILTQGDNCFIATNLGISSVASDGTIHNYSKEMGLQDNEFNTNASLKINSGKLFFGGVNGITAFYPASLTQIKDSALVHITQLTVNDSSYNSSSGIWHGDTVLLNYNQNRLRFDAAAMGILNANEYIYQYRLKNIDTVWQTTYQPTNISYTLQPGNYTLEINCHPLLSSGKDFFKSFYITITPPWWQTWWFRLLAFACAVGIIYFIVYRYNRSKYLKQIRLLETQHQLQIERERISRELHDNIGAQVSFISSNIDWLAEQNTNMLPHEKAEMQTINQAAKNVMSNLRETIWALNKENISISEFSDKLKAYIQNIIRLKPAISFEVNEEIKAPVIISPSEALHLFRICQELVNNAVKHSAATILKLFVYAGDENFKIIIEDNGKGFIVADKQDGHYGLQNMQYRAKELGATLDITSAIAKGTKITIMK